MKKTARHAFFLLSLLLLPSCSQRIQKNMNQSLRVEQFRASVSELQRLIDEGVFERNLEYERIYERTREEYFKVFVSKVDGTVALVPSRGFATFSFGGGKSEPAVKVYSSWERLLQAVSPPPYLKKGNGATMDLEGLIDSEEEFLIYQRTYRQELAKWLELAEEDLVVNDSFQYDLVQFALTEKIKDSYDARLAIHLGLLLADLVVHEYGAKLEYRELLFWEVVTYYLTFEDGTMIMPWAHTLGHFRAAPQDRNLNFKYYLKHVRGWAHHHLYDFPPYEKGEKP
ncbi:hypothetical protein QWY85_20595 [Neolewinella lacunae]|uniref:Uncharacterized protein n=1 Tax=Neolewinella lacunae TaxID=1517758 RepID=A0A923PGX6_9BACT|nr:hypothetical protein [Neolewinella lacunae]MBC6993857.1 hypothetical protein [Neolewinella lacunae]MDN3637082.1 hypothetical protein [Neolewinella lacunae]